MVSPPRAEDNHRIDHVGCLSRSAQLPRLSRTLIVEWFHFDLAARD